MLAHRGGRSELYVDSRIGLGARTLVTTPEQHGELNPLKAGTIVLAADARIDNRDELFGLLGYSTSDRAHVGDVALIAHAFRKWGEDCVEHLIGDFAFAIWNESDQSLFCARDRMGVRPIYYYASDSLFAFASEIKSLFCLRDVPRDVDEMRVASHLLRTFWDRTSTFYRGVLRLPPATTLTVTAGGIRTRTYWQLDATRQLNLKSDDEFAEAFRELFAEAVRCRTRSATPVGALLSGGLDSSSVAVVAREVLRKEARTPLHTLSGVFDEVTQCDERPYIDAVNRQGDCTPHYIHADSLSPLADIERVLWHMDEPFFTPHISLDWALFRAAKDAGVRVVLGGMDGDTAVGHGFAYQTELLLSGRIGEFLSETRAISVNYGVGLRDLRWRRGLKPAVPDAMLRSWHWLRGRRRDDTLFSRDFADRVGLVDLERRYARLPARSDRDEYVRALNSNLIPYALEGNNRTAAAFGVETRHPFYDSRLLDFCVGLPPRQRIRNGVTRIILRNAVGDLLPTEIGRRRDKANLGPSFTYKLITFERERVEELLSSPREILPYVDMDQLGKTYRRWLETGSIRDALEIWVALMLELGLAQIRRMSRPADEIQEMVSMRG
ncbi:MAG: asparagine synthetase B [bacterium]|nr:asparagine synthetase B [Candidatus Kapabacteria bacterium]